MVNGQALLEHDLLVMEKIIEGLDDYLRSDATYWTGDPTLPKLTLGGFLMRQDRLEKLRDQLPPPLRSHLDALSAQFQAQVIDMVTRVERRAHEEIRDRIREWVQDLRGYRFKEATEYANKVDVRVVLEALIAYLHKPPYCLAPDVAEEVAQLDEHLRRRWKSGAFIWPAVYQPAYPPESYWWLYGSVG